MTTGSGQLLHNIFAKNQCVSNEGGERQENKKTQFGALANKIVTEDVLLGKEYSRLCVVTQPTRTKEVPSIESVNP